MTGMFDYTIPAQVSESEGAGSTSAMGREQTSEPIPLSNTESAAGQEGKMPIRKTPLMEASGVKLVQVDDVSADGRRVRATHYRLSTLRPHQPRVMADRETAEEAFDLEVIASLGDPTVQRLV